MFWGSREPACGDSCKEQDRPLDHPACRGELYPCETDVRLCDELETDEEVEVDMETDVLTVLCTGKQYNLKPIGDVSTSLNQPSHTP